MAANPGRTWDCGRRTPGERARDTRDHYSGIPEVTRYAALIGA